MNRLLDGAIIHLINTDPPYNVKIEPRSNNAIAAGHSSFANPNKRQPERPGAARRKMRAKDRPSANDYVSEGEFDPLLNACFGNMARVLAPGCGFYLLGGYANLGNYPPVLKEHGLYFS